MDDFVGSLLFGKFGEKAKSRKKSQMKYFKPNNFKKAKEKPNFEKSQMKFCKPSAFKKSQIGVNLACPKKPNGNPGIVLYACTGSSPLSALNI